MIAAPVAHYGGATGAAAGDAVPSARTDLALREY